jgi:hypothetical protein
MRLADPFSACVQRLRGSPSNHEGGKDASTLGKESTPSSAVLGNQPLAPKGGATVGENIPDV